MSEKHDHGVRDFSPYDAMTTQELETLLRLDAEAPEDRETDTELLFYVMGVLADRRKQAQRPDKTPQEAYEAFTQHYLPDPPTRNERRRVPWLRPLSAAAAAVVIVIGLTVSAHAFHWDLWDVVARWARETFSFIGCGADVDEPQPVDTLVYDSLQDALKRSDLDPDVVPTWIPEGYRLESIKTDVTPLQELFIARYRNGENDIRITVRSYLNTEPEKIEQSGTLLEIYPVGGTDYYILENNGQTLAAWLVDSYECYITGTLPVEELKLMIDSIGKG